MIGLILVVVSIGLPAAYLVNGGGGTGPLSKSDAWGALLAALVGSGLGLGILIPGIRGTFSADVVFDRPAPRSEAGAGAAGGGGGTWRCGSKRWNRYKSVPGRSLGTSTGGSCTWRSSLNLVLTDDAATRVGLGSHGDEAALMADADKLADFLGRGVIDDRGGDIPAPAEPPPSTAVALVSSRR